MMFRDGLNNHQAPVKPYLRVIEERGVHRSRTAGTQSPVAAGLLERVTAT